MIKPNRNREKEYFRTSNNNNNNFSRKNIIIMSLIMSMIWVDMLKNKKYLKFKCEKKFLYKTNIKQGHLFHLLTRIQMLNKPLIHKA